jgi:hypothetical protein
MEQAKIHQDPIVACITDWQFLCVAFAKRNSGNIFVAISTIFFEKSTPVGFAPSFLTAAETYPGPHATSNTGIPAKTPAASIDKE